MAEDVLAVWMDGFDQPAGHLGRSAFGATAFAYNPAYVEVGGIALSLALPIELGEFGDVSTRAFFTNLLPEDTQLQRLMEREQLARDDVVGLLRHLGADCAGSISCLPEDRPPVKTPGVLETDYEILDDAVLLRIARALRDTQRVPREVRDPSPVAGVQSKVALTRLPDGRFALPSAEARAPTTHILKVPRRRDFRDVRHEEAAAILGRVAGLDVSVPEAITIGDVDALLIERFDRRVVNGVVYRIHQEDFAQALGLPSDFKYERNGQPGRRFDVAAVLNVLDRTSDPAAARLAFLKTSIFNLCIGNTDNHAKNHALLYDAPGAPRLAPLYDMLPIRLSAAYTHELAYRIGEARFFDEMTADDVAAFFQQMGVPRDGLDLLIKDEIAPLIASLEANSGVLRSSNMKLFDDLLGRELEEMVGLLGLTLPVGVRDYFPAAGRP